ncbi:MAG TPA: glycosyltransferase family 2 protein [Rickettsiales bacterium]|nr:glycosyltransferase family 2 protein [Rickettsiales bacterium]
MTGDGLAIDICICTFRRPGVVETLRSLSRLHLLPQWEVRVLVADNDDWPSARDWVMEIAAETGLQIVYIHAPARNISTARNACLDAATAHLVAFLDDDELATEQWLVSLVNIMQRENADVVLGPVLAVYPDECPAWMRQGDFHSTRPTYQGSAITTGYCGNALLRREAPAVFGKRFRADLGRSGGEDTAFFADIHTSGGVIAYAPEALVTEAVPRERAQLAWLLARRFRYGQTYATLWLDTTGAGTMARCMAALKAAAKALFCFAAAPSGVADVTRGAFWLLRGSMHTGAVLSFLSFSRIEPYGHNA